MKGFPFIRILDRYIFGQFFTTFILGVTLLCVVLVLGQAFRRLMDLLMDYEVPLEMIASFIAFALPYSLTFTIPWSLLTGVLLLFGRLSAENELIALRSLGMSVTRLTVPIFVFTGMMCGLCWWINVEIAPRSETAMKKTLYEIATNNPLSLFSTDQIIDAFPGKRIYVETRLPDNSLRNIQVYEMDESNLAIRMIVADSGRLDIDREKQEVVLRLENARYQQRDANDPNSDRDMRSGMRMADIPFVISLNKLYEANSVRLGLSSMTTPQLKEELERRRALTGKVDKEDGPTPVRTEIHKRYSFSLACAAFVLLGIPLGITAHRKETSVGFGLSVVIALGYYLLIIGADILRNEAAAMPHLLIWMPNVLFFALGAVLFYRMTRR